MDNIDATIKGNALTLAIDLGKTLRPSKSGKSMLVASSAGRVTLHADNGQEFKLNLTIDKPRASV